jgi:hypothetical protein
VDQAVAEAQAFEFAATACTGLHSDASGVAADQPKPFNLTLSATIYVQPQPRFFPRAVVQRDIGSATASRPTPKMTFGGKRSFRPVSFYEQSSQ